MKFGKSLAEKKVITWAFYYLDYNEIKKLIVRKATSTVEMQQREANFAEILERELTKINSFHSLKASELLHAVKAIKQQIEVHAKDSTKTESSKNWFEGIMLSLDNVSDELIRFDDYKIINVDAFAKLLKKHDKHQPNQLRGFWQIRLNKESFVSTHNATIDKLLLKLSKAYFRAREVNNQGADPSKKKAASQGGQVFERTTTKYWVPEDKVLLVKAEVLKNLPISSFNKRSSGLITSVYYDNDKLEVYHERLKRLEGSIIVRMRTYNEGPHSTVYVERKVHHDSWVAEKSVKSRFMIKEKNLIPYLRGELSMEPKLKKMLEKKTITQKDFDATLTLANEIQKVVVERKLQPTMTSRYERTAFQLEGDATVRVSLDSRFDLIREFGYKDGRWGRDLSDEGSIMDSEIHHFPHAILEIKLSVNMGEQAPLWVQNLLAKDYIISCGKFSKFIHGCAVLIPKQVSLLPSWFPQLEDTSEFKAEDHVIYADKTRANSHRFPAIRGLLSGTARIDMPEPDNQSPIPVDQAKTNAKNEKNEKNREEIELTTLKDPEAAKPTSNQPEPTPVGRVKRYLFAPFKRERGPRKKRVQAPIKVEPKTFFANERTFLQWMSFLIFVQGIGFALMTSSDILAIRIGGLLFICIALLFMLYAISIFLIRRVRIARRERGPYDERFGPVGIVVLLIIGIVITVTLYYGRFTATCKAIPMLANKLYEYNPSEVIYDYDVGNRLMMVGPDLVTFVSLSQDYKVDEHPIGGDWEGLTKIPGQPNTLYLGMEYPPSIHVTDQSTFKVSRVIYLDMPKATLDAGLEALAWVPDKNAPHGGYFWAGSQVDGKIYLYDVDLSVNDGKNATLVGSFSPLAGVTHLQGLTYDRENNKVIGVVGRKFLFVIDPTSQMTENIYGLGVGNPEGAAYHNGRMYIACDLCGEIWDFKFNFADGLQSGRCGGAAYVQTTTTSSSNSQSSSSLPSSSTTGDYTSNDYNN